MPPLNLAGDFGGGSMFLLVGILAALWERQTSGKGQVVDAAMVDGSSVLIADDVGDARRRACGPTSAAPTCSTAGRRTTTPTSAPTAATSRSARSSRSSTRELLEGLGLDGDRPARPERRQPLAGTARAASPRRSPRTTATTGPRCSPAPTRASRRCCRSPRCETEPHITERDTFYRRRRRAAAAPAPRFSRSAPSDPQAAGRAGRGHRSRSAGLGIAPEPDQLVGVETATRRERTSGDQRRRSRRHRRCVGPRPGDHQATARQRAHRWSSSTSRVRRRSPSSATAPSSSQTNVTDEDAVTAALDVAESMGPLRINVNCAGIGNAIKTLGKDGPFPLDGFNARSSRST